MEKNEIIDFYKAKGKKVIEHTHSLNVQLDDKTEVIYHEIFYKCITIEDLENSLKLKVDGGKDQSETETKDCECEEGIKILSTSEVIEKIEIITSDRLEVYNYIVNRLKKSPHENFKYIEENIGKLKIRIIKDKDFNIKLLKSIEKLDKIEEIFK